MHVPANTVILQNQLSIRTLEHYRKKLLRQHVIYKDDYYKHVMLVCHLKNTFVLKLGYFKDYVKKLTDTPLLYICGAYILVIFL